MTDRNSSMEAMNSLIDSWTKQATRHACVCVLRSVWFRSVWFPLPGGCSRYDRWIVFGSWFGRTPFRIRFDRNSWRGHPQGGFNNDKARADNKDGQHPVEAIDNSPRTSTNTGSVGTKIVFIALDQTRLDSTRLAIVCRFRSEIAARATNLT